MGVRNCRDIGENLIKIMKRLIANDKLVKYLHYTDKDPLNNPNLTPDQKSSIIYDKLIKITPIVPSNETAQSIIVLRVIEGSTLSSNTEFKEVTISVEVFVPLTQWFIKDTNLRPFAILGEIQDSLNGIKINGLGRLSGGDFSLEFITTDIACYEQTFTLTSYD